MHITPANFDRQLAQLRSTIAACDFVAIDTELTGLLGNASYDIDYRDTLQAHYSKRRASAQLFQVVQYGVACFTWEEPSPAPAVNGRGSVNGRGGFVNGNGNGGLPMGAQGRTRAGYVARPFNFHVFPASVPVLRYARYLAVVSEVGA
ncbi:hypothetical protein HK101_011991 [Irineochytrium annulatum]|nr:hypothetical protein HK101_011991 [Irineochytrium annulatum]